MRKLSHMLSAILASCFTVLLLNPTYAIAQPSYSIVDLGTLGGNDSAATGINNSGWVAGHSKVNAAGDIHAFLHNGSQMIDIGTLGGNDSEGESINESGWITGHADCASNSFFHAFLYNGSTMQDLGTLGGTRSWGVRINNSGIVVGFSLTTNNTSIRAFIYDGTMRDIGTLPGHLNSVALGINDLGVVVGHSYAEFDSGRQPFVYDGSMNEIPTIGTGGSANDINNSGVIVGNYKTVDANIHAFLYDGTVMRDIDTLGGSESSAVSINSSGLTVGYFKTAGDQYRAFLYDGTVMHDLNSLIPPGSSWDYLEGAADINDLGQIVGKGYINGVRHAFLMTPKPGDISIDGIVDLQDAISALQVVAGISVLVNVLGDINGDRRAGLEEALYAMQSLAGLRNRNPELAPIGNKFVDEGSTLSFTIAGSDPDGDSLNYTSSNLPVGAIFNPDTKTFSWTPYYSQSGAYDVTFTVVDIHGASDSETIAITVNAVMCAEYWHYTLDGSQGSGDLAFAEQQGGIITVDGNWVYNYSGAIATGSFTDGAATIEGTSASFIATGTATHPYAPSSPFTMNVSLITNNGQASGTYTMTFSNFTWAPMLSGNVVGTRTSGSGITQ